MQNFGVTYKQHYGMLMVFLEWSILRFQGLPLCPEVLRNAFRCFNFRHNFVYLDHLLFMKRFCHDPQLASCTGTSVHRFVRVHAVT